MTDHVIYKLKEPIQHGEELITELKFRTKVVAGDLRGITVREDFEFGDLLKIAGRLSAQPDGVINKIAWQDVGEVVGLISGFMGGGRTTGTSSSAT